jgi:photosystem II stability/assembly factor-like uncharacterized protein
MRFSSTCALIIFALQCASPSVAYAQSPENNAFCDPLDSPASPVSGAAKLARQPVLALARVNGTNGPRVIAAGLRGLILLSDDGGEAWRQARVPVQSDLVSLSFISREKGWAVGHEGVILHTEDGGETWVKQFDGRMAHATLTEDYKSRLAKGEKQLKPFLDQVELNTKDGPTQPFLSVLFESDKVGYAVGSFGMLVETQDGGKTWHPWLDHIDNDNFLNLNDIREVAGNIYVVGEQGSVFRLDREKSRFVSIGPVYKGSFFRVVGNDRFLLVVGLNGTAFRSTDSGATWKSVQTGATTSLTSASFTENDKALVLTSEGGGLLLSIDEGNSFHVLHAEKPMLFADALFSGDDWLVLGGYQGVERQKFRPMTTPAPLQN